MSAASDRSNDSSERRTPRQKSPRLSPELDEVLRMLKALEDQPDAAVSDSDKSR